MGTPPRSIWGGYFATIDVWLCSYKWQVCEIDSESVEPSCHLTGITERGLAPSSTLKPYHSCFPTECSSFRLECLYFDSWWRHGSGYLRRQGSPQAQGVFLCRLDVRLVAKIAKRTKVSAHFTVSAGVKFHRSLAVLKLTPLSES